MMDILDKLVLVLIMLDGFLLLVLAIKKLLLLKKQRDLLREIEKGKGKWARVVYVEEENDD